MYAVYINISLNWYHVSLQSKQLFCRNKQHKTKTTNLLLKISLCSSYVMQWH